MKLFNPDVYSELYLDDGDWCDECGGSLQEGQLMYSDSSSLFCPACLEMLTMEFLERHAIKENYL